MKVSLYLVGKYFSTQIKKTNPDLQKALNRLLTERVELVKTKGDIYSANLGNGITGEVFPGGSFEKTSTFLFR